MQRTCKTLVAACILSHPQLENLSCWWTVFVVDTICAWCTKYTPKCCAAD